jgi:nanoRNase/pAp phosphatase (c-di-AMP/oligoRNAs hydrolase)
MSAVSNKFRLVTRSDFDGLVCAVLLKHLDLIDDILFVHPKDMQDGKIAIGARDITTNLPYVAGAHLVFDMMAAVDKGDAARFNREEVLDPKGWDLLNFLMDARTGLGRFRDFRISNYQLMMDLIEYCKNHTIGEIMELPDVKERKELYFEHSALCKEQIRRCATVHKNLVVLDLREEETIYAGNRFIIYALYPETNISIHVLWGLKNQNTVFATGKSILNRTSKTNIGALMLEYGGGGHENAGTCQVSNELAEEVLGALIHRITGEG